VFVMLTLSLVCAVFSPVWDSWRQGEKHRRDGSIDAQDLAAS
jgi:hypothetical protein